MAEDRISIQLFGDDDAMKMLQLRAGSVRRGARIAMNQTTIRMRARVKQILATGKGGAPTARHGGSGLSGTIVNRVWMEGDIVVGILGSTMRYKKGYAAILEKGGPLPQVTIVPKKGKVLAWPIGVGKFAFRQALSSGRTPWQARGAAIKADNRSVKGLGGGFAYARKVTIPARYQRAMPYLRPGFEEERPLIPVTFKTAIRAQLKGGGTGEGGER